MYYRVLVIDNKQNKIIRTSQGYTDIRKANSEYKRFIRNIKQSLTINDDIIVVLTFDDFAIMWERFPIDSDELIPMYKVGLH